MEKLIRKNWFKLVLSIIIFILLIILTNNQIEIKRIKKQDLDLHMPQRVYNLPTATEVFHLRQECVALGQKILDNNIVGAALTSSQVSHYNPVTNRCYIQLTTMSANLSNDYFSNYLFDGQTGEMLASATKEKGKKEYGSIFSGPAKTTVSDPSETTFQSTNDYIGEIMNDDWKQ